MKGHDLFRALIRPFEPSDLEWRAMFTRAPQGGGQPLVLVAPYVNRPALVNRLNQVCGLGGWQTDVRMNPPAVVPAHKKDDPWPAGHVSVGLGILVDGEWIWRWDGAGLLRQEGRHFKSSDAGKGDFSNGFKRACELFGIALYLRELKPMKALLDSEGRYKSNIEGFGVQRWNPPPIRGTPSYPGVIPGFGREEGEEEDRADGQPDDEPPEEGTGREPPPQVDKQEDTEEERAAGLRDAKENVRRYMNDNGYKVYHLDAVVQVHPDLKLRFVSGEQLGREGGLEDWRIVEGLTKRNRALWDDAPKQLAKEFPTGPERLQELERRLDAVQLKGKELVELESAKQIGWNDAIEWWIEELGKR